MKYLLFAFNCMVAFVMMFALCSLDSDSWVPFIMFAASALYLMVVGYFYERSVVEGDEE